MAAAAVATPSYNRVEPGSVQLQAASYPSVDAKPQVNADEIAAEWVKSFNKLLAGDLDAVKTLFLSGACWRDELGLTWNYHTLNGTERIQSFLRDSGKVRVESVTIDKTNDLRKPNIAPVDYHGNVQGVASFLNVESDVGRGRGLVRLLQDTNDGGRWKAFTLLTAIHELKGHEESVFGNRPHGVDHGGQPGRKNWLERRTAQENFEGDLDPTVLIIGTSTPTRSRRILTRK